MPSHKPSKRIANGTSEASSNPADSLKNTGNKAIEGTPIPGKPDESTAALASQMPIPKPQSHADARKASGAAPPTSGPFSLLPGAIAAAMATDHQPVQERKRGRRLRTLTHVKGGLAHTIRELESGRMEPKTANALTYAYSALAGVMGADVTKELQQMQDAIKDVANRGSALDA